MDIRVFLLFAAITVFILGDPRVKLDEKKYFRFEHLKVEYYNRKYLDYVNASTRRYSRRDPLYYLNFNFVVNDPADNNVTFHFYALEWLTNQYKRSFVEAHVKACNLMKHPIFGVIFLPALRKAIGERATKCPFPKGPYNVQNMTMPAITNFPFQKGRIFMNVTQTATDDTLVRGYLDFEIVNVRVIHKTKH